MVTALSTKLMMPASVRFLPLSLALSGLLRPVLEPEPRRRSAILTGLARPVPHNLGVECAGHAVVEFRVQLGQLVAGVDAGLGDVPHGGGLDDVADHELLDGLVLGTTPWSSWCSECT